MSAIAPRAAVPDPGETIDHANEHRGFAAMQMIGAGRVDDEAIGWIGRGDRGETLKHPAREPVERLCIGKGIGVLDEKAGHQEPRLGLGHADTQAGGLGGGIRRQHHPPSPVTANQDERRLNRRRGVA